MNDPCHLLIVYRRLSIPKNGSRNDLTSYHKITRSVVGKTTKRYGGIIIYSLGTAKIKTGKKIKPGYIYILNGDTTIKNSHQDGDDGQIQGTLCRMLTGRSRLRSSWFKLYQ